MIQINKSTEFSEYWLSYLASHKDPANRMCHYIGTSIGIIGGLAGLIFINLIAGAVIGILGYSVALIGHFYFEKNLPHAHRPHLSLMSDFCMMYLFVFNRKQLTKYIEITNLHTDS